MKDKMIPLQQQKSSRQSSILKIPKSSSSLQHGEDSNTPSVENSPTVITTKIKRRVSFAEKKHVKEFCDSIEQGTVWDNTYEESELSQMRTDQSDKLVEISQMSSINHYQSQSLRNIEIDSLSIVQNKSCSISNIKLVHQNAIDHQLLSLDQSLIPCNLEFLSNKENIPAILTLSTREDSLINDEDIIERERPVLNTNQSLAFSIYCDEIEKEDEVCLNSSNHENISMECTMLANDSHVILPCSEVCNNIDVINDIDQCKLEKCKKSTSLHGNVEEKTQVFNDNPMEMTEAINATCLPNSQKLQAKSDEIYNKTMELTECIPNFRNFKSSENIFNSNLPLKPTQIIGQENQLNMKVPLNSLIAYKQSNYSDKEKTQFFHDKSMEMTEVVPNFQTLIPTIKNDEKTQFFHNKSMEMTEIIPNIQLLKPNIVNDEKTQFFHNKSMEITEVVPNIQLLNPNIVNDEKTQFFHNKSMEMTEVVPIIQLLKPHIVNDEKTQFFHNKSMEMTEVVPIIQLLKPHIVNDEKTPFFHNKSMEITEAVANTKFSVMSSPLDHEKTEMFSDTSMEMTEAISNVKIPLDINAAGDEKTQFFHNKSIEITEAVPNKRFSMISRLSDDEKTRVFHNKSMEMTEMITSSKITPEQINPHLFCNRTVESTETILPSTLSQSSENINHSPNSISRVEVDHNYFMELTEAISSLKRPYSLITTENKFSSVTSSPNIKNSRHSLIYDAEKNASKKDLEKLHQLLYQNSSKDNSPLFKESLPFNNLTQVTNIVSDNLSTDDNDNAMEMTKTIQLPQKEQSHVDQVQKNNYASIKSVNILDTSETMEHISSNSTLTVDKLPVNESNNSLISKQADSFEGNLSEFNEPLQSNNSTAAKTAETSELIQEKSSHYHMLESPNSSKIFNKTIDQNSISSDIENNFMEKIRSSGRKDLIISNKDIPYDLTEPILRNKDIIKDDYLELEETPSFIYNQSSSEKYQINKIEIVNLSDPQLPSTSFTIEIDQMNLNEDHEKVDKLSEIKTTNDSLTLMVEKNLTADKDKNKAQMLNVIFNDCQYNQDKEERKINKTETCVIKQNYNDPTDITEPSIPSITEYNKNELLDQCYNNKSNHLNLDKEKNVEESYSYGNGKKDHELIDKCKSVILEYDLIVEKIMKTKKYYENLRNEMKYRHNSCLANIEKKKELKDISMSTTIENFDKSPYEVLKEGLQSYSENIDCIWHIYVMNSRRICIEYYKTALFLLIKFHEPDNNDELERINTVNIISRLKDEEPDILRLTDRLIIHRIDTKTMEKKYKTYEDIPNLIAHVTDEIKLIYDLYDDLEKVSNLYLMNISEYRISFNIRTKHLSIILKITINFESFPFIRSEDIDVVCILGSIEKNNIQLLVNYIEPRSKFLSTYIKSAENLINLLEESNLLVKK